MGKFGFSWSWKRATGISSLKGKVARATGIPTTRSGRQRKLGRMIGNLGVGLLLANREPSPVSPLTSVPSRPVPRVQKLRPKYVESWLLFAARRTVGLSLLLFGAGAVCVAASWCLNGTWLRPDVFLFGIPGLVAVAIGLWLCRGRRRDQSPMATAWQLDRIAELHGALPRQLTMTEANKVIEFLESHVMDCPYCGAKCKAVNVVCGRCRKRLDDVRVPIGLGNV